MKEKASVNLKKIGILILSIIVYVVISTLPTPEGLPVEGQKAIALMISAVIVWATEIIPITIASLIFPMLTGVLGILPVGETLKNFTSSTILFMAAAQLIAAAFTESGVGERVSLKLSFIFGNEPNKVLFSFMFFTGTISMFLVDIPTAIIFSSLAYSVLRKNNCNPGDSNFGRAIMIGIPISAAIGGFGTPVGSGLNILTINLLESTTGVRINFLQWSMVGIPTAIILIIISWLVISKTFKPEMTAVKGSEDIKTEMEKLGPLKTVEKKFIAIFGCTAILWLTQPVTQLDNTMVACLSAGVLSLTGIDLIKWEKAKNFIGWDGLYLVGSSTAIAMTLVATGASKWLGNILSGSVVGLSAAAVIFIIILVGILSHIPLPVGGAMVALMVPIAVQIAESVGMSPVYLILPLGFTVSCVFLIPLDPIPLTTYNYKYWKMGEMMKVGFIISAAWIVILTAIMVFVYNLQLF